MIPSFPHGPHLPFHGELLQRAIVSAVIILAIALLIYLMAMVLALPHNTVISLLG